jgi:hypothetical protein
MKDLDFKRLFEQISSIGMLSLTNCGLEIGFVFAKVAAFRYLSVLCLSGNRCNSPILHLPPRLTTVYANGVAWEPSALAGFITRLSRRPIQLSIEFASVMNWKTVFATLGTCERGYLRALDWNENRIHPSLFNFLNRNHELESLSLSACFKEKNEDGIGWLLSYLSSPMTKLKWLELRGSDSRFLGPKLMKVVEPLFAMKTLLFLDVSGNNAGEMALELIRGLAQSHIKQFVVDGLQFADSRALVALLREVAAVAIGRFSFPHTDLNDFVKQGKLTDSHISDIRSLFRMPATGQGFFDSPFQVFRYFRVCSFPTIVTAEEATGILRESPKSPVKAGVVRPSLIPLSDLSRSFYSSLNDGGKT